MLFVLMYFMYIMYMLCFCTLCSYATCEWPEFYVNKDMFCSVLFINAILKRQAITYSNRYFGKSIRVYTAYLDNKLCIAIFNY